MENQELSALRERLVVDLSRSGIPNVAVLGRYSYRQPHPPLAPHQHPGMVEICYLQRGHQTYWVGPSRHEVVGGEIFVTFPGETHGTGTGPEERGMLYWLLLRVDARKRGFLGETGPGARALASALLRLPRRSFRAAPGTPALLDSALRLATAQKGPLDRLRLKFHLLQFLISVIDAAGKAGATPVSEAMLRVMDCVQHRVHEPPGLPELSRLAGLSLSRFKARFREEVGVPPSEYIARARIAASQHMLPAGRQSITEVAHAMGFASSQHFATVFKRYTGLCARDWLVAHGKQSAAGGHGPSPDSSCP